MPAFRKLWISIAFVVLTSCAAPAQSSQTAIPMRRMLYAVPEALPTNYSWRVLDTTPTDVVWVGARIINNGSLRGANAAITAMLRHSSLTVEKHNRQVEQSTAVSPAMEIHSYATARHYLLVGLADAETGVQILTDPDKRKHSQSALLQLVKDAPRLIGLQLDFEYLPAKYAGAFTDYIRTLRAVLPREKALHVAVFPPVGMPEAWRGFHDLPGLATVSDGIVVMLYDYHRQGTSPGCVSSIGWLNENARALATLPREKIWLGAPLYGYHFAGKKATATGKSRFEKRKGNRSEADGCYRKQSAAGETFYPSPALYAEYDRLGRENGFAGVAYWRAGLER